MIGNDRQPIVASSLDRARLAGAAADQQYISIVQVFPCLLYTSNIVTGEAGRYFPLDLVAILACAELSYWAVERPSLRLRDRLRKRTRSNPPVEVRP